MKNTERIWNPNKSIKNHIKTNENLERVRPLEWMNRRIREKAKKVNGE